MKRIIMASSNKGKIAEAKQILKDYEVLSAKEIGIDIEIEEDKDTLEMNACKKAEEIAKLLENDIVIADDSGIEVAFLDGFPGVLTKRWHPGTDREKNESILERMKGVPKESRNVRFTTAIGISDGKKTVSVVSYMDGYVSESIRGNNGFGFDEIFELDDGRTLAELSIEEKNSISSRKKALELARERIEEVF